MKTNVGGIDKILRIGAGVGLVAWALLGGPASLATSAAVSIPGGRSFFSASFFGSSASRASGALPPPGPPGIVVCNPPYGERLLTGRSDELAALYAGLGETLKRRFVGWTAFVFTANLELITPIGLRPRARRLGGLGLGGAAGLGDQRVVGDHPHVGRERAARGVPAPQGGGVVVEEAEEDLLHPVGELLAIAAPPGEQAGDPRLEQGAEHAPDELVHRPTIPAEGAANENRVGLAGVCCRNGVENTLRMETIARPCQARRQAAARAGAAAAATAGVDVVDHRAGVALDDVAARGLRVVGGVVAGADDHRRVAAGQDVAVGDGVAVALHGALAAGDVTVVVARDVDAAVALQKRARL